MRTKPKTCHENQCKYHDNNICDLYYKQERHYSSLVELLTNFFTILAFVGSSPGPAGPFLDPLWQPRAILRPLA